MQHIPRFKDFVSRNRDFGYILLLSALFVLFVIIWSQLSIYRLTHVQAAVFDLGAWTEQLWLPLHSSWTVKKMLYQLFYVSIIPVIFSPFSLLNSQSALLVLQTVFIWASVFPLYFISRKYGLSSIVSFLVSVSYFFFFPIAGMNFFDIHNQSFFPFFFLLSYTFYSYGYRKTSFVLFSITTLVKWPYDIFVIIFALYETFIYFYRERKLKRDKGKRTFLLALLGFSIFSPLFGYYLSFSGGKATLSFYHISTAVQSYPLGSVVMTIFMLLAPVLFLPAFSRRWALFLLPFFILMALAKNNVYFFPTIFKYQYSAMFAAFIFLGIIDSLSLRSHSGEDRINKPSGNAFHIRKFKLSGAHRSAIAVLIILVLMSVAFQPWSPLVKDNSYMTYWYDNNPYDNYNTYSYLEAEAGLVPVSNPYVLVTNGIPEAFPRPVIGGPYHIGILYMGFPSPKFLNITVGDAFNNSYPYITFLPNGKEHTVYIPIDYAWSTITDAVSFSPTGYQSMVQIMDIMLESGKYGILAEANGTIVLEWNYTYPPEFYVPMNHFIAPSSGGSNTPHTTVNGSYIFNNVSKGSVLWYVGTVYYPGMYNDTLHFETGSGSYGNISITAVLNGAPVSIRYINVPRNASGVRTVDVSFSQVFNEITLSNGYYYFIVRSNGWYGGNITFSGTSVNEVYTW